MSLGIKIGEFVNEKGEKLPTMIDIGMVIHAIIGFVITAAIIFFIIIKPANKLMTMMPKEETAALPPEPSY